MGIMVQKFGGTSLADEERRERAIYHIKKEVDSGNNVIVVVSAMGRKGDPYATDSLLGLLGDGKEELPSRELDLLLSTGEIISAAILAQMLWREGIPNSILTGGQSGIITNERFGNAQIVAVKPKRILEELKCKKVVIVPGFQGQTLEGDITTLGRGGSDTTATALGAALDADYVDIFTDVEGIMTADPNIVENARHLKAVTYTEICNLAYSGAKVIHPRAVEIAMQKKIPIRVRSTFRDEVGTLVTTLTEISERYVNVQDRLITGITQVSNVTQIKVEAEKGKYDSHYRVFAAMAENGISVDFINVNPSGVVYTVFDHLADQAEQILLEMGYKPQLTRHCAKVSVVGAGIAGVPGVMAKVVSALLDEDITILQSADSHTTIWVLVLEEHMSRAVKALHQKFELDRQQA